MEFPSLARLRLAYDDAHRVRISEGDRTLIEAGLDTDGRRALEDAVTSFVAASPPRAASAATASCRCGSWATARRRDFRTGRAATCPCTAQHPSRRWMRRRRRPSPPPGPP